GKGIEMHADGLADGDLAAIGLGDLGEEGEGREVRDFAEGAAGPDVVADFEGLGVHPALGVVHRVGDDACDGGGDLHLLELEVDVIEVGLGLVAQALGAADLGAVGGLMGGDGGLLDLELLLRHAECELALVAVNGAEDGGFGGVELGGGDGVLGGGEIEGVLLLGDAGGGFGLVERGLGLLEGGGFGVEILAGGVGVEAGEVLARLDDSAAGREPGDGPAGDAGGDDLDRALGLERAAHRDRDQELAAAGDRGRNVGGEGASADFTDGEPDADGDGEGEGELEEALQQGSRLTVSQFTVPQFTVHSYGRRIWSPGARPERMAIWCWSKLPSSTGCSTQAPEAERLVT